MKCIKMCSIHHRDLALKYEKIRIGTNKYYANITEPVLHDEEEKTKKFTLEGPVKLNRKELENIGANILCDVKAGKFIQNLSTMDYFMFSSTIDGNIKERAELLNKNAGYKITDSSKFSKMVMNALFHYLYKDNKIPSPKYRIGVSGSIQYNNNIFQSRKEFLSRMSKVKKTKHDRLGFNKIGITRR